MRNLIAYILLLIVMGSTLPALALTIYTGRPEPLSVPVMALALFMLVIAGGGDDGM